MNWFVVLACLAACMTTLEIGFLAASTESGVGLHIFFRVVLLAIVIGLFFTR